MTITSPLRTPGEFEGYHRPTTGPGLSLGWVNDRGTGHLDYAEGVTPPALSCDVGEQRISSNKGGATLISHSVGSSSESSISSAGMVWTSAMAVPVSLRACRCTKSLRTSRNLG